MSYSPPPGSIQKIKEISFEEATQVLISVTDDPTNPIFFAKWQIVRDGQAPAIKLGVICSSILGVMKRDSGVDVVQAGIYTSVDNITYNFYFRIETTNPAKTALDQQAAATFIPGTENYLAAACVNTDGATTGTLERFAANVLIHLPPGHSIKRIL